MAEGKRNPLIYVGIGCGVLLIGGTCVIGAIFVIPAFLYTKAASSYGTAGAEGYARAFFRDVREGKEQDALRRMSGPYQATHTLDQFRASLASLPPLKSHTEVETSTASVGAQPAGSAGSAELTVVQGQVESTTGEAPIEVKLTKQNGYWYIDQVSVGGKALP